MKSLDRWTRWFSAAALLAAVTAAVWAARTWPLVGDAALLHYVVFAMRHGIAPYRELVDINLPGTYFFEALGMRLFGGTATGWRLYDLALLLAAAAAFLLLAKRLGSRFGDGQISDQFSGQSSGQFSGQFSDQFSGVLAASMFALIHLQDGIFQVGQRDLLMAVLLLWAYVALFAGEIFWFGLAMGAAATVKPVLLPLAVALLAMSWARHKSRLWWAVLGLALPPLAMVGWLARWGSLGAFRDVATGLLPLHAAMGKQGLGYLLAHALAPVWLLVAVWVPIAVWAVLAARGTWDWMRLRLAVGIAGAFLAYAIQGKGYPYQRYPLLALMLLLLAADFDRALNARAWVRCIAITGCLLCVGFGLRFAWVAHGFSPAAPFQAALTQRLAAEPSVQCLDTFGGCIGVLYQLGTIQSTGYLYDCYLFAPPSPERTRYRQAFQQAFAKANPQLIVVTDQFCFGAKDGFTKLTRWPELTAILTQHYTLTEVWHPPAPQHWWSRRDTPTAFRLYRRRKD